MDIIKGKKMPEKPLKNFNFYRNIGNIVPVEQIVRDYNKEHPDKLITAEDVKFGPLFHGPHGHAPIGVRKDLRFVYNRYGRYDDSTERNIKSPQGVFVFEEESKEENLAEVLGIIEHEQYLDSFTIKLNSSNDYESFHISDSELVGIVQSAAKANNWQFRQAGRDASKSLNYSELYGYLTVDDDTYQIRESPRGLTFFDKHGEKIKSGEGEMVMGIMGKIQEPVQDKLQSEENEWLTECGGEYPDPDP